MNKTPSNSLRKGSAPSKNARSVPVKRNNTILNFFQKADGPPSSTSSQQRITQFARKVDRSGTVDSKWQESAGAGYSESLFIQEEVERGSKRDGEKTTPDGRERSRSRTPDDFWVNGDNDSLLLDNTGDERFNENDSAVKKRRMDPSSSGGVLEENQNRSNRTIPAPPKTQQRSGPFIDGSDSEDDLGIFGGVEEMSPVTAKEQAKTNAEDSTNTSTSENNGQRPKLDPPSSVSEATSDVEDHEYAGFNDVEVNELQGEEFLDQPWEEDEPENDPTTSVDNGPELGKYEKDAESEESVCPVCQTTLGGLAVMVQLTS